MAAPNQGERAKAYRLRKAAKAGQITPIDRLWLDDFDHRDRSHGGGARVHSRKGRKIDLHVEEAEEHAASGDSPAAIAAAAALQERAAGERLDSLTVNALAVLKEAVITYKSICHSLRQQLETYQSHHLDTLASVREHYIARTKAEAETIAAMRDAENSGDPAKEMMLMALMNHLGISPPAGAAGSAAAAAAGVFRGAARPNGAAPKAPR